jgi:hypothetical protein
VTSRRRTASTICSPTVVTGLRATEGSWKIIEIPAPRSFARRDERRPSWLAETICSPWNVMLPLVTAIVGGRMPRIARRVMLLPEPDSPTNPRASPGLTVKDTSSRM